MRAWSWERRKTRGRGFPGWGRGGDGAELHEAEAEPGPDVDALGVFVEAGGEPDGIGESEAEEFSLERRKFAASDAFDEAGNRGVGEGPEGGMMHCFRGQGEEEGTDQSAIEHGDGLKLSAGNKFQQENGSARKTGGKSRVSRRQVWCKLSV